ncbi:uncharacterized protein PV07_02116 [Cladophialophora immunda]|uniref:Uncharacterized protein n=1 Tax=Cladophialophora immunda TaxID=569365 RepID=A0A0D2DI63_9EURO|nr:uncharacterized protein PV07_02116 [Cladophialophora immunda]KIW35419.1 hypothetical protein PV07_02116 [Cladophialophora immunda]
MSSTTSTLPDDAFRSYVLDFLRHVPPAALNVSGTARSELEALAGEYYETSQDVNMQEFLLALHARYDLVGLGFFEKSALNDILVQFHEARGKGGAGAGRVGGGGGSGNTLTRDSTTSQQSQTVQPQQRVVVPEEVRADLVGVSSQFAAEVPMPAELDPKDLGIAGEEGRSVRRGSGAREDYVVGWKTEFVMTPEGAALVYKQSRRRQRGAGT